MEDDREAELRRENRLLQLMQLARLLGKTRATTKRQKKMFAELESLFDAHWPHLIKDCYIVERKIMLFRYEIVCSNTKWFYLSFWDWFLGKNVHFHIPEMEWEDWYIKNQKLLGNKK